MKKNLLFLLLLVPCLASAQKYTNIWYFGSGGAGINFNTCPPTALTNGWNNAGNPLFEGSTAISNANGSLLFYSNGQSVFNANHVIMQNGNTVGPGNTLTQNIIVPKPGSNTLYYLFSPQIQAFGGPGIVKYSTIDMSLNSGLGAVVSSNIILRDTIGRRGTEKLMAVKHANGTDIWLIGHDYNNNKFFAYLITASGINAVPVESSVGPVITDPPNQSHFPAIGELKASPDGTKLGFTCIGNGLTAVFQFNNATGIVSNPILLDTNDGGISCSGYGVSFSPDNSKFYVNSTVQISNTGPYLVKLFQFDLASWNAISIQNSRYTISTGTPAPYYSIKLGPDKKIYVAKAASPFLGVINAPNASGAACNFVDQGFNLGLPGSWGLNTALEMFDTLSNSISVTASTLSICPGSTVALYASGSSTYSWQPTGNFPGSGASSVIVMPANTTTYSVSSTNTICAASASFSVVVNPVPNVTISANQTTICTGAGGLILTAGGATSYTWSNSAASITISPAPSVSTSYSVTGFDQNGCINTASIEIAVVACVGISETENSRAGFMLYPNPNTGQFVIQCDSEIQVKIYNGTGEEIINACPEAGQKQINFKELFAPGIYTIAVSTRKGMFMQRMVVTR